MGKGGTLAPQILLSFNGVMQLYCEDLKYIFPQPHVYNVHVYIIRTYECTYVIMYACLYTDVQTPIGCITLRL